MPADILIIGQGLAGTLLAWEFERAGIPFVIADCGHATAATFAAAGIINPITGRRLVQSWRFEEFFPAAAATYRELEKALGVSLWHDMRVRRSFADDREREWGAEVRRRATVAAFIESADADGWWIRSAARVDLATLLAATRKRWLAAGKLREVKTNLDDEVQRHELVIDCRGLAGAEWRGFDFVPWEFSKGELLELRIDGLEAGVVLNRRFWIVPVQPGVALAGATHEPGIRLATATTAGRATIETALREILGPDRPFLVTAQRAGIRVNLPDKRPVAGRHPLNRRVGLLNGLGAKGALWAPTFARQWVNHLLRGAVFDPEVDVRRFAH